MPFFKLAKSTPKRDVSAEPRVPKGKPGGGEWTKVDLRWHRDYWRPWGSVTGFQDKAAYTGKNGYNVHIVKSFDSKDERVAKAKHFTVKGHYADSVTVKSEDDAKRLAHRFGILGKGKYVDIRALAVRMKLPVIAFSHPLHLHPDTLAALDRAAGVTSR